MNSDKKSNSKMRPAARKQRGVALVLALLLLVLLSGLGLVMVISSNSDLLTNGYYRGFRGAFYAADSGLSIVRNNLAAQVVGQKQTFSLTTLPFSSGAGTTVASNLLSSYGGSFQQVSGSSSNGSASNSWPGFYELQSAYVGYDPSGNQTWSCAVIGGKSGDTCTSNSGTITGYTYTFPYQITVLGRAQGSEKASVTDEGNVVITASLSSGPTKQSFAAWGMFINNYAICSGSDLVPGTISGPVFTNGAWNFGTSGQYIFTDPVGSVNSKAGYDFGGGTCNQVAGPSDSRKSGKTTTTIAPTFQQGFSLGQQSVPLPTDDFNQEQAVLDGKGSASSAPTNAQLHSTLMDATGTAYPSNGTNSGVFLPYQIVNGTPTFTGGGIYVQGNASVQLSTVGTCTKNSSGQCTNAASYAQVYTITTSNNKTTTITVNPVTNTTTMVTGGNSVTITGVPEQYDPTTGAAMGPATMLYDNGNITALSGPGQGVPAIQDGNALTITANGNVTVTGDILYKTEPVTTTQNQIANTPADTLIPNGNNGQSLGIFTANGNVQMANSQSNGNLEIDASIATLCSSGGSCTASSSGGLVNTGSAINTLNIVGGRIQNNIMNIGATTRNVFFDRRYANGALSPPWFPSTTVNTGTVTPGAVTQLVTRTRWTNNTAYF